MIFTYLLRKYIRQITINPYPTIGLDEIKIAIIGLFKEEKKDYCNLFENRFSNYLGVKYSLSFGKGRIGLYAILTSLGIKQGDEVLVPGYTCVVVPNAIIYTGAKPVYYDVGINTFNPLVSDMKKKITFKTKAIIIHHLFGQPAEIDEIKKVSDLYHIPVIEDCAQALGAEYKGKKVGTFFDFGFFSFDYTKNITTGQGGIVVVKDKKNFEKMKAIQQCCKKPSNLFVFWHLLNIIRYRLFLNQSVYFFGLPLIYLIDLVCKMIGLFNTTITKDELNAEKPNCFMIKMHNIFAKIGLEQLKKIDLFNKVRINNAMRLDEELKKLNIETPHIIKNVKHIYLRYALCFKERQKLINLFRRNQVDVGCWFDSPIYPLKENMSLYGYDKGNCPNADKISKEMINLPTHSDMNYHDIKRIINILKFHKKIVGI
ncbi:DegT/DnrJ/EryC1/StrS family aminotransferase [Candidatus Woesearchaeota archaeon]|nr:DegT/DnrJ/EryC1/StrS family aminotransferase [Candidatus Woesearchaeota archaeon]